jgi:hypothetical protein
MRTREAMGGWASGSAVVGRRSCNGGARPWQGIRELGHVGARMASMVRGAVTRAPRTSRSRGRKMAGKELGADAPTAVKARAGTHASHGVDAFSERQLLKKNRRRCSLVRRGRSAAWGRTVRDLAQGLGFPA